jgi:hypothetical protein
MRGRAFKDMPCAGVGHMQEQVGISEAERARIRSALKHYKATHGGIGDLLLGKHIAKTIGLPIDLSTLQRFLRGKHRTDDVAVTRYRSFLRKVAPPAGEDMLGQALREFLSLTDGAKPLRGLAGKYRSLTRSFHGAVQSSKWRTSGQHDDGLKGFKMGCSAFKFERGDIPGLLRVRENIKDDTLDQKFAADIDSFESSGFLLPCGAAEFFMVMRGFLDRRFYMLRKVSDAPAVFRGLAFAPQSPWQTNLLPQGEGWQPAFEIVLAADQRKV